MPSAAPKTRLNPIAMNTKFVAASVAVALLLGGCGLGGPAYAPPTPRAAAVVDMGLMSFNPPTVNVRAGESIEWKNTSLITHTVTDDPGRAEKPRDAELPTGAAIFDSGDIAAGKTYLHKFSVPGTYHYFCEHHEKHGMVGTIIVTR
jgi:plastocyanin